MIMNVKTCCGNLAQKRLACNFFHNTAISILKNGPQNSIGICLGASSVSLVELTEQKDGISIISSVTRAHLGNVRSCLQEILHENSNIENANFCVTGRKLRHSTQLSSISEPEAVELAARYLLPEDKQFQYIISAGGETFFLYQIDKAGYIHNINAGNKCASGTGEFFLQQLHRMNLSIETTRDIEQQDDYYTVSGRCSVFCKSDCTHALNKGISKGDVVNGLTAMMASKLDELFGKEPQTDVVLIGGCSRNEAMVHHFRKHVDNLFIPEEADCFEAVGAALWGMENDCTPFPGIENLFIDTLQPFTLHEPLSRFQHLVDFKSGPKEQGQKTGALLLGLDVGSTTTKGILLHAESSTVVASTYLRTNGDPIGAAREVYKALANQIGENCSFTALGVTGSGRQIAGLHGSASAIINEIVAHATAAAHYDPEVDTIFEIGGQDAKYTYLTNGSPSDYAMNEACSAGTGSFLEESAQEGLGIKVEDMATIAFQGNNPPNFNDQCAAFISSDIKSSIQHGVAESDIVAGLVYSVCINYINRVVGNRPIGRKIFAQGGVCYNSAVPTALAALTGKEVVVPPDPGLMGALGVALELKKRIEQGIIIPVPVELDDLATREIEPSGNFICHGGKNGCDNKCRISMITIDGKKYPFGGICNRFDNLLTSRSEGSTEFNHVAVRQNTIFQDLPLELKNRPSVKMNRSFLLNTFFPFYKSYFSELGLNLRLPEKIHKDGMMQRGASFCYPVELAHGYAAEMATLESDYTFLPQLKGIPHSDHDTACTCVFVQSEPFYIKSAFPKLDNKRTLTPTIDLSKPVKQNSQLFEDIARQLNCPPGLGRKAFKKSLAVQEETRNKLLQKGKSVLEDLSKHQDDIAIVLFGRPYNAFAPEANKGIPLKFASRNIRIIPFDMLPCGEEQLHDDSNMYWGVGNLLLRTAKFVANHPQLFGTFITNFSCGPDSFIVSYFRDIMRDKPSLTLELDSHTADAGLETRIEAFLDIINSYNKTSRSNQPAPITSKSTFNFGAASIVSHNGDSFMKTSTGELVPFTDERVRVLLPAMGRYATPMLTRAFIRSGIKAINLPPADEHVLKIGKANSNGKECLPLQTTLGSILNYALNSRPKGELSVYFMPSAPGPCRFGQYNVFTKRTINRLNLENIAVFSPSSENSYGGVGKKTVLTAMRAITIGDLFEEMRATLLAGAVNKNEALQLLEDCFLKINCSINEKWSTTVQILKDSAEQLRTIPLQRPYSEIPKISLIGEIYVRHDPISLQNIVEKMADRGFIVRTAQISEWLKYIDWLIKNRILGKRTLKFWTTHFLKERSDAEIRKLLAPSGLYYNTHLDIDGIVNAAKQYISPQLQGETILTVGSAFHEIMNPACGVISIGPFGCMPSRVAEAILKEKFRWSEKNTHETGAQSGNSFLLSEDRKFPFLAIETDGNPFPQIIEARLEAFCLQAERLHKEICSAKLKN